ncbi:MAG: hypothetical protein AB1793_05965 [Candidatus Thermoplasmatota archaeon]
MISKVWIALALGAAFMVGGVAVVSAAGNMNGDCDQIQDQLKDGTGDNCQDETLEDGTCDSCNDYDWDFLYGETELEPPYQSACGQE